MKRKAIIFDIDGTLADNSHRTPWVKSKPKNWGAYNATMSEDKLIKPVATLYSILRDNYEYKLIICTGREDVYKDVTDYWLTTNEVFYDELYMRKEKDYRDDTIVKEEMLKEIQKNYEVAFVFDDRPSVCRMWRDNGLFVFNCQQGEHEF